jgi:DNA-binding MarR family transcriptional regulator
MVTTGAMTKRIDRLERSGLVTRRRSDDDQRGRIVALTGPGRELIDQAFTDHMRNERHLLDLLPPAEASSLETLLTTWLSRVEHPRATGEE